MGPLRGDGKNTTPHGATFFDFVEKMGPLRGDGKFEICVKYRAVCVEKMGPLRGDGNSIPIFIVVAIGLNSREDGAPSWGRNPPQVLHAEIFISREDGSPLWGRKL